MHARVLPPRAFLLCIFTLAVLHLECQIDHGLSPIRSKVGGTVIVKGDRVPPGSDQVRVAVAKDFPPKNIKELLFSDMLPFKRTDSTLVTHPVSWEIYLPPGRYAVAAVLWKENNAPWNISDVIGVYGGAFLGDLLLPLYRSIDIPTADTVVDTLCIEANINRVNRDAKIEGAVSFRGPWPANTGAVGIGAFTGVPQPGNVLDYYFKNTALDYGIPVHAAAWNYRLRVRSGEAIRYVAVVWINAAYDLTSMKDIGFYPDPSDPSKPGALIMEKNGLQTGVDILVDFTTMDMASF
jgi:hypothetical protein